MTFSISSKPLPSSYAYDSCPRENSIQEASTANPSDSKQDVSAKPKCITLLNSGGVRKNEEGKFVSFFLRQSLDEISENELTHIAHLADGTKQHDPSMPWPATRHAWPFSYVRSNPLLNRVYKNKKEFEASPEYQKLINAGTAKINIPGKAQRIAREIPAKLTGMVGHGWSYEQVLQNDGTYAINLRRLYVSSGREKVGTVELPTRKVELYEFSRQSNERNRDLPKELKKMQVFIPESKKAVAAYEAGKVRKIATVNCHELGKKYLLYRSPSSMNPDTFLESEKRKLVIFAHGVNSISKRVNIPAKTTLAFAAPDGHILFGEDPLFTQNIPLHSKHEIGTDGEPKVTVKGKVETSLRRTEADKSVPNILLSKFGSPIHDIRTKNAKQKNALNNQNERAAWAAHDLKKDILILRQHTMPVPIGGRNLENLLAELEVHGVEFDEIEVHTCRPNFFKNNPYYGVGNNLNTDE